MTLNKGKITKINELRQNGYSIRKIAKRLRISKDTVWKYCRSPFSIPETQLSGYQKDIGELVDSQEEPEKTLQLQRKPFGSFKVGGWYTSELPRIHYKENDFFYKGENRRSRIRGIPLDQPYNEPDFYYPREMDYYDPYFDGMLMMQRDKITQKGGRPIPPWAHEIPVSQMKHQEPKIKAPQKSQLQISREQKRNQTINNLTKRLNKLFESKREEFESKKQEPGEHYLKAESQLLQLEPQKKKEIEKYQNIHESTKKQLDIEQEKPMQLIEGRTNNEMQTLDSLGEIHSNKIKKKGGLIDKDLAIDIGVIFIAETIKIAAQITAQKGINNRNDEYTHVRLSPIKYKKVKLKLAKDKNE